MPKPSADKADRLIEEGLIVHVPTAMTFNVAHKPHPYEVTYWPADDTTTCKCEYGLHHGRMPAGHECYHGKAARKLALHAARQ